MIFTARLRRLSLLWADWRRDGRIGGTINGIQFRWRDGAYRTVGLDNEQVALLLHHPFVEMEAAGFMPEPEPVKPEPTKPEPVKAEPAKVEPPKPAARPVGRPSNGNNGTQ